MPSVGRAPELFERIPFSVSRETIRGFFNDIPATYDWINILMTGGLDRYWRKKAARLAARNAGRLWLDICAGTGRMSVSLSREAKAPTTLVALDFCSPMLRLFEAPSGNCSIHRCLGDVGFMPFPDDCFDLVTVSFATRNLHTSRENLVRCFNEIRRVLKPGGRFMNLETSQPSPLLIRRFFHWFIRASVHLIGSIVSGSSFPYQYLASSIQTFYTPEMLSELLGEAGFQDVTFLPMTFGVVAAHLSWKR